MGEMNCKAGRMVGGACWKVVVGENVRDVIEEKVRIDRGGDLTKEET